MALLTAEDVLNKQFSKTKYREGFDQDEVDDFLDEVATTIAELTEERDRLRRELDSRPASSSPAPDLAPRSELLTAATDTKNPPSPASLLAMAQKLHDDYVRTGEQEKERIVFNARTEADRILHRAKEDAEERLKTLGTERGDIERRIDDLRRFERDYRSRLRTYLENLLGDLDHGAGKDRMPNSSPNI